MGRDGASQMLGIHTLRILIVVGKKEYSECKIGCCVALCVSQMSEELFGLGHIWYGTHLDWDTSGVGHIWTGTHLAKLGSH